MSAPASDGYPVLSEWAQRAWMNRAAYESARTAAGETPDAFWSEQSRRLDWMTTPTRIKDVSFEGPTSASAGWRTGC